MTITEEEAKSLARRLVNAASFYIPELWNQTEGFYDHFKKSVALSIENFSKGHPDPVSEEASRRQRGNA